MRMISLMVMSGRLLMNRPDQKVINPRPRAVFADEDYALIHKALSVYIHNYGNSLSTEEMSKYSLLMHRLGRIKGTP